MIDLKKYSNFVDAVTSTTSKNVKEFKRRVDHLDASQDVNVPRLLTASIGISGEVGEFNELSIFLNSFAKAPLVKTAIP